MPTKDELSRELDRVKRDVREATHARWKAERRTAELEKRLARPHSRVMQHALRATRIAKREAEKLRELIREAHEYEPIALDDARDAILNLRDLAERALGPEDVLNESSAMFDLRRALEEDSDFSPLADTLDDSWKEIAKPPCPTP